MVNVYLPGVFDVLHIGHLNYLRHGRQLGDRLIVGVQDDRSVSQQKGVQPVVPLAERMAIIEALEFVDEVVSYVSVFQGPLLDGLGIDVLGVGEGYACDAQFPDQRRTIEFCQERGIHVVRLPRTPDVSSTMIRRRLKEFWNDRARKAREASAGVTVLGSFGGDTAEMEAETRREVDLILQTMSDAQSKRLRDIGCGDGRLLVPLAKHFGHVTGIDYAKDLLELARQRVSTQLSSVELVECEVTEFRPPERFDVLLLSGILPYLDDAQLEPFIRQLADWGTPQAKLFVRNSVGVHSRINVVNQYSEKLQARYTSFYRTANELIEMLSGCGWDLSASRELYQHGADTAMWWLNFDCRNSQQASALGQADSPALRISHPANDPSPSAKQPLDADRPPSRQKAA